MGEKIRIMKCANCGKELFHDVGDRTYTITETLIKKPCEKCHQSLHEKKWYGFCCGNCLVEWVKKNGGAR